MISIDVKTAGALSRLSRVPEYVGTTMEKAASDGGADLSSLPPSAFADGVGREYPRLTKEAVFTSFVKYTAMGENRKPVLDELLKAARAFGITNDCLAASQELSAPQEVKSASASRYAIPEHGYFPLDTLEDLEASMGQLRKEAGKLTLDMRVRAASAMIDRAEELGAAPSKYVVKAAAILASDNKEVAKRIMSRIDPNSKFHPAYSKVAFSVSGTPEQLTDEDALKIATALSVMDKQAGLTDKYDTISTPEEVMFDSEPKQSTAVKLANGFSVDMKAIKRSSLTLDDLMPLGEKFINAVGVHTILAKNAGFDGNPNINYHALASELMSLSPADATMFMSIHRKTANAS